MDLQRRIQEDLAKKRAEAAAKVGEWMISPPLLCPKATLPAATLITTCLFGAAECSFSLVLNASLPLTRAHAGKMLIKESCGICRCKVRKQGKVVHLEQEGS